MFKIEMFALVKALHTRTVSNSPEGGGTVTGSNLELLTALAPR